MSEVKHRVRAEAIGLAVAVMLSTALFARWWIPRPALPAELPALALDARQDAADLAAIEALAEGAPEGELEARRRELYLAQGLSEIRSDDTPDEARTRHDQLDLIATQLAEEGSLDAARAADILRMAPALRGEGSARERGGELGAFPESLARWGAVREGRRVASAQVVRALFHARWNAVHTRALTEGMSEAQLRAYHGWLALHGEGAPAELRLRAAEAYRSAGGPDGDEAVAMLLWLEGDTLAAHEAYAAAFEATGSARLRNHGLAALLGELSDDDLPP